MFWAISVKVAPFLSFEFYSTFRCHSFSQISGLAENQNKWEKNIVGTVESLLKTLQWYRSTLHWLHSSAAWGSLEPPPGQSLVQWDVWCWQVEPGCRLYRPYVTMCWPHSHSKRNEKTPSISVLKKTTGSLCSHVCVLCSANGSKTTAAQWHMASITFHSRALVNTEWRITSVLLKPHLQQISDVHHQRYR